MYWDGSAWACVRLEQKLVTEQVIGRYKKLQRRMPSVWVSMNYCIKYYFIFYRAFIIDLIVEFGFIIHGIWNLSGVFIPPFLVICNISIISSIDPMKCLLSQLCCAHLDFTLPYFKFRKCSRNLIRKGLSVCPTYFLLQSWHVKWRTPHLLNLFGLIFLFWVNNFPTVFSVLKETLKLEFLNISVTNLFCLPTYVNLAHLFCVFTSLCSCSSNDEAPPSTRRIREKNTNSVPSSIHRNFWFKTTYIHTLLILAQSNPKWYVIMYPF